MITHVAADPLPDGGTDAPAPSSATRRLAPIAVLIASVSALLAAAPLRDNSVLTHLATGRVLLESGLPESNPFLYTGTSFPVPSWWWSILLAAAETVGGAGGVRLLAGVVAAALGVTVVLLTGTEVSRPGTGMMAAVVAPALALFCSMAFLNARPHLVGFLLLALMLLLVRGSQLSPWWVAAIFAVWVNVHGSWLYGVILLAGFVIADAIDRRSLRLADLHPVLTAVGGIMIGGLVYPQRLTLVLLPARQLGDPLEREALSRYGEWSPLGPGQPALWGLFALGVLALAHCARARRPGGALLVFALVLLGASGSRLVPIAAISLVGLASASLVGAGRARLPRGRRATVVLGFGTVAMALIPVYVAVTPNHAFAPYPVASIDWLDERGLVGPGVHLVSHDYVGNYLAWRLGSEANAYVDDRPDAATFVDYVTLMRLGSGWREAFARAEPDVVLWRTDRPLADALDDDPEWSRAVEHDGHAVWCRSGLADRCS